MIQNILDLLNANDFYGVSENVEIAKGKHELPKGWKDSLYKIKRHRKSKKEVISWQIICNKIKPNRWQIKQ
jgi:hypothetical protein